MCGSLWWGGGRKGNMSVGKIQRESNGLGRGWKIGTKKEEVLKPQLWAQP